MKKHPFVQSVEEEMHRFSDEETAIGMKAYMRDQFEFLGVKKPFREIVLKKFTSEFRSIPDKEWMLIVQQMWKLPYREFQYMAMEFCKVKSKNFQPEHLPVFEHMVTDKSWWDTVDFLASNLIGELFRRYPELIAPTIKKWTATDNFWLHRTAIIFQLKYGKNTDEKLLFQLCSRYAKEKEFFIRKAIGWALRQYSKSNPAAVKSFLEKQQLSPLSVKEASKYI
jgi:3-methyladenine DNA glycosylase AlkD